MKDYIKRYWFDYIFAVMLIVFVATLVTIKLGYVYSSNDDVMMRNIINGNYTGSPDSHLIFISFLMASLWKKLYEIFPNVSWYDLFMVGLHYLCWFLIVVRLGQQMSNKKCKIIIMLGAIILLVVVDLKYLVISQFTVISSLLSGVSVFWMLTRKKYAGFECGVDYFVIFAVLIISSLFRKESFLLSLPIMGLAILFDVWKNSHNKKEMNSIIKKTVMCAVCFCILYLLIGTVESIAYSDNGWTEFLRSQDARPQIYDYSGVPALSEYEDEYSVLGIDYADWMAIYTYNCELVEDFDADMMEGVSAISLQSRDSWRMASGTINLIKKCIYTYSRALFETKMQPISVMVIIAYSFVLLLCYALKDKKMCIISFFIIAFFMIVSLVLIDRGRYLERVAYGMYFLQLICLIALVSNHIERISNNIQKEKVMSGILLMVMVAVFGFSFIYSWQATKDEYNIRVQDAKDWKYVNSYFTDNSDNIYCIDTESFFVFTEMLFTEKVESDNVIRLGSWMLNSPLQQQRMEKMGAKNLVQQLAEDEHFYIVQEEWKDTAWIDAIWSGKGYDVQAVVVDVIATPGGRAFEVIQMQ